MTQSPDHSKLRYLAPAAGAALLIGGFGMIADEVLEGDTVVFDRNVTLLLRDGGDITNPVGPLWVEEAGRDLTALGSFAVLGLIVIATVLYFVLRRKFASAIFVAVSVISGTLLSNLLKEVFDRPRPDVEAATRVFTSSFPSGHSALSAVVYLTLGALLAEATEHRGARRFFIGGAIVLTLIVGVSRIYLGVHYPTDVIAGWCLGTSWALLCGIAYAWLVPKSVA